MGLSDKLNRRVRARPADDDEVSVSASGDEISGAESEAESNGSLDSEAPENSDSDSEDAAASDAASDAESDAESASSEPPNDDIKASLASISFGALAKAQNSMSDKKRKSKHSDEAPTTSTVDEIRAKLREAREAKELAASKVKDQKARTSKHAPMAMSSKRAVTRRRTAVELPPAPKARDPRFDAAVMGHSGVGKHSHGGKAYAFLDEYRASELAELKETLKKTKNYEMKEKLKAQIRTAQDKMRSAANKKREEDVRAEHKSREKQLIKEGKKATPYYLKNSDLKKQVLEKKFGEMGSRERGKALERRRKKVASKEKKSMPWERRGEEDGGFNGAPNGGKRRRLE
ncbi:unnamed protein product [Penicillium bialowiezense]